MTDQSIYTEKLERRDIRPTAMRILILKTMIEADRALSILDLENLLETAEKSTIFRTITLFLTHQLVHCIDDGSGSVKYAVCDNACTCSVEDLHSHFYCEGCKKTFCMDSIPVPVVQMPKGFTLQSINYVLKGLCADCSVKQQNR